MQDQSRIRPEIPGEKRYEEQMDEMRKNVVRIYIDAFKSERKTLKSLKGKLPFPNMP
ncbi:MAG: hypothetical protein LBB15_01810 [Puniceicoccales bacterium]|jgi:hypothetical protein|nr:hypothetical protein [Puniceicoccales bacterium]